MARVKKIRIENTLEKIKSLYGESDLFYLIASYADEANKNLHGKIKYPDFFTAVRSTVIPDKITNPKEIGNLLHDGDFTYHQLYCFRDYATIIALYDLASNEKNDLGKTLEYFKELNFIDIDILLPLISNAEKALNEDISFRDSDEITKSFCRDKVSSYARKHSITEEEAAKILCAHGITKPEKTIASKLYFPVMIFLAIIFFALSLLFTKQNFLLFIFLLFPLSELAKTVTDTVFSHTVKSPPIPRIKLDSVPDNAVTLTVITSLITCKSDCQKLARRLRDCYFSNRGNNVRFGLLCDLKESDSTISPSDNDLINTVKNEIDSLNSTYNCNLYLFIRSRRYCVTEEKFLGWERKRGAVIELTRLLSGKDTSISVLCGDTEKLFGTRYVITLDSDTRLGIGAVCDMVGAMIHPSNRPVIKNGIVISGHAILQPKMETSLESLEKTPFAVLSGGSGGTDIYASASYETYQSIFDEGIFCGKGIFDLDAFSQVIDGAFPDETVLSHDLLEGSRLRAGALTAVSLTDDQPKNPISCLDRSHRWIRGDVQALSFAGKYVSDANGNKLRNPISLLSRFKIYDNVRRAFVPVSAVLALLCCLFESTSVSLPAFFAATGYILFPCIASFFFLSKNITRRFNSYVLPGAVHAFLSCLYGFASLLQNAVNNLDAIIRASYRMLFSRRHLLQWKTASESERDMRGLVLYLYRMLPSLLVGIALMIFYPAVPFKLLGALFALYPFAAFRIGIEFKNSHGIGKAENKQISLYAKDMWGFFCDTVTENDNFLPPDNIQFSPVTVIAHRTSPTNIGLYLLSCLSACDFGFISFGDAVTRIRKTFDTLDRLPRFHGHLYNWYDTEKLEILGEPYISTVDSGNFVTSLIALRNGIIEKNDGTVKTAQLIAKISEWINDTDFSVLYDSKRDLFFIGINAVDPASSGHYDLLMSECRTTSYYAVASGQVPKRHFAKLSRPLLCRDGYIGLASWTGTMFEYLMPALVLPTYFGSLSFEAVGFALRQQRKSVVNNIWGRSESGFYEFDADMNYQYRAFGVPSIGLKQNLEKENVIAPYASFLALPFTPVASLMNLGRLEKIGAYGKYGFCEAVDFTSSRVGEGHAIIHSYMAHHTGMCLVSCANACFDNIFVKRFMSDPVMCSGSGLLEERIPVDAPAFSRITARQTKSVTHTDEYKKRIGQSDITKESKDTTVNSQKPANVIFENGIRVSAVGDMMEITSQGRDISVSPFVFGDIHRMRLLFEANGKVFDALSGTVCDCFGTKIGRVLDTEYLTSKTTVSVLGSYHAIVISLDIIGRFGAVCPMLEFEPCLAKSSERAAHPAFSDISVSAEYSRDDGAVIYRRRGHDGKHDDFYLAVSCESRGTETVFRRDILGLMYREEDFPKLYEKDFITLTEDIPDTPLINPFCAVRKYSDKVNGRYKCDFLLVTGKTKDEVLSSLRSLRNTLSENKKTSAADYAASLLSRCVSEGAIKNSDYISLLLKAVLPRFQRITEDVFDTCNMDVLYRHGISGDRPIITLSASHGSYKNGNANSILTKLLSAHKYLATIGIRCDLVILTDEKPQMEKLCYDASCGFLLSNGGGLYVIERNTENEKLFGFCSVLYSELTQETTLYGLLSKLDSMSRRTDIQTSPSCFTEPSEKALDVCGGSFRDDGFTIYKGKQSAPWSYCYSTPYFGTLVTQNSLGYSWIGNSHQRRITPYLPDALLDMEGERLLLSVDDGDKIKMYDLCACSDTVLFGRGCAVYNGTINGGKYEISVSVDAYLPCKTVTVKLPLNLGDYVLSYKITPLMSERISPCRTISFNDRDGVTLFTPLFSNEDGFDVGFFAEKKFESHTCFILGAYRKGGEKTLDTILKKYSSLEEFINAPSDYEKRINSFMPSYELISCDKYLDRMVCRDLPLQALTCRIFGRTGFYQSGGAFGFRDQLQDCLAFMLSAPDLVRTHIIRCACHQYEEGDVMHWWHTAYGVSRGVRTRYSDDLLWLPFVSSVYCSVTGDEDIFDIPVPYLSSPPLSDTQNDRYEKAVKGQYRESLYYHCTRAINHSLSFGSHGLALMNGGDWNDGMNKVGIGGGESVWLSMFLITVLEKFLPIVLSKGDMSTAATYRQTISSLRTACDKCFEDGRFLRAFYSDGTPIDSENGIDLLPQAFAVFSGCNLQNARSGLSLAAEKLFDREHNILKLLFPPYDRVSHDPGYIASYPPGIRENGGQYTHASVWAAMAMCEVGMNDLAAEIIRKINPASICSSPAYYSRYGGEPYFIAGDVCSSEGICGKCGWSGYTGSAAWYVNSVIYSLIGLNVSSDCFTVTPHLSDNFPAYSFRFKINGTDIMIIASLSSDNSPSEYRLDGKIVNNLFYFDKKSHLIEITVEKKSGLS